MEAMTDLPLPEPKPIDEENHLKLQHLIEDSILKGKPYGTEECDDCLYYLEPEKDISYCWHPKIRVLVGAQWWCQWWEETPAG